MIYGKGKKKNNCVTIRTATGFRGHNIVEKFTVLESTDRSEVFSELGIIKIA